MTSKADIEGWFSALEKTLEEARITQYHNFQGEVIKKVEKHSDEIYFFFESGKWAKIGYASDNWGEPSVFLNNDISIYYDMGEFLGGDIVTKHTVETARKFHSELNNIAYEERDRQEYERLKRKFGDT